jgi:hypothetical protein
MSLSEVQLKAHFKASGRNWDQLCQAAVVNASIWSGGFVGTYASANDAYHASKIASKNAAKAPLGAVHYWAIGKYGHVAGALGGGRVFMASKFVDVKWGINVGTTTVDRYTKRTGAKYLGWSYTNGSNRILFAKPTVHAASAPNKIDTVDEKNVVKLAKWLNKQKLATGKTTADKDGKRGKTYWTRIQLQGKKDGSYGAGYIVDGEPGAKDSLTRKLEKKYLAKAA